jgi:hypothetical protein
MQSYMSHELHETKHAYLSKTGSIVGVETGLRHILQYRKKIVKYRKLDKIVKFTINLQLKTNHSQLFLLVATVRTRKYGVKHSRQWVVVNLVKTH